MLTPMMAWDKTQKIGLLKAEKARAEALAELYEKLEKEIRAEAPAYKIDGIEYAIHVWLKNNRRGPYLYEGIRADFAQFAGDSPAESFDDLTNRLMI